MESIKVAMDSGMINLTSNDRVQIVILSGVKDAHRELERMIKISHKKFSNDSTL